jgi:hypothetical protein
MIPADSEPLVYFSGFSPTTGWPPIHTVLAEPTLKAAISISFPFRGVIAGGSGVFRGPRAVMETRENSRKSLID